MFLASLAGEYCTPVAIGFQLELLLQGAVLVWPVPFPNGVKLSVLKNALALNEAIATILNKSLVLLIVCLSIYKSILLYHNIE